VAACSDKEEIGGGSATVEVIGNPVTGLSISNAADNRITLTEVGSTVTAQVTATPSNADDAGNYTFASSDVKIFTVTDDGLITATGYGEATLSVVNQNDRNVSVQCKILVGDTRIESLTIAPDYQDYEITRTNADGPVIPLTQQITITPSNASIKTLKYSSSNPEVAIVSEDGDISPLWEGTTVIKAEAIDGSGKFVEANLKVNITPITSLSFYATTFNALNINNKRNQSSNYDLSPADYAKGTGTTSPIRYQPTTATRNTLEYSSSDPEVLEIESTSTNGFRLVPKKSGRATITAKATDGYNAIVTSNPINVYDIYPTTDWRIIDSSPTGEVVDGGDTWGGPITNFFEDGKQVGFYRTGTPEYPTGDTYFVIDFGQSIPFNYLIYSHSWSGNWNNYSRANRQTLFGSNDGTNFTQIGNQLTLNPAYNAFSVMSQVSNYRYLKVVLATSNAAYSGSGNTYSWTQAKVFMVYDFFVGYLAPQ
jgi:uncharacterized protein YjdB